MNESKTIYGSGGMFVQSEKFVESHGGTATRGSAKRNCEATWRDFRGAKDHRGDISICGQESNPTTRRLAVMNLALRRIEADFGLEHSDTFRRELHPNLRADYVLANPPFNDSDWFRKDDDVRCYGAAADKEKPTVSQYSKRLVDALPYLRNALAHGSSEEHEAAANSVHIFAESINQLFPDLLPRAGIAGDTG